MPLQNRVQPDGQIIATASRGTFTGNRGILHVDDGVMGQRRWTHKAWICCALSWQNRKRPVMQGRKWTELFFLDEAVAFAAGHRPCAFCRRGAYQQFQIAWAKSFGTRPKATQIDLILHQERIDLGTKQQRRYLANCDDLPFGTIISVRNQAHLVAQDALFPYTPNGYGSPFSQKKETGVIVQTPRSLVALMRAGYKPALHHTVRL